MSMTKLAGFGCSFLYGYPDKVENSVAYHLADKMGLTWINKAVNAGGNDLVYERLIVSHGQAEISPVDTFVLIGWSESFRKKVFTENGVILTYRPPSTLHTHDGYEDIVENKASWLEYFTNTNRVYYDTLKDIINTYHFLEYHKYDYLMFDSFNLDYNGTGEKIISFDYVPPEFVDIKNNIKNYYNRHTYRGFLEYLHNRGEMPYVYKGDNHPNESSARKFSDVLYNFINSNSV